MPNSCHAVATSTSTFQPVRLLVDINLHSYWPTVHIQISWLLRKPTNLELHCLQRHGISGFSKRRVQTIFVSLIYTRDSFRDFLFAFLSNKNCSQALFYQELFTSQLFSYKSCLQALF